MMCVLKSTAKVKTVNDMQRIRQQLFIDATAHPYHITINIIQL